jgi:hypothetical protein
MTESELRTLLAIHDMHIEELEGGKVVKPATTDGMCSLCFAATELVDAIRGVLRELDALRAEVRGISHGRT